MGFIKLTEITDHISDRPPKVIRTVLRSFLLLSPHCLALTTRIELTLVDWLK